MLQLSQNVNIKNELRVAGHLEAASWSPAGRSLHKLVRSLLATAGGARRFFVTLVMTSRMKPACDWPMSQELSVAVTRRPRRWSWHSSPRLVCRSFGLHRPFWGLHCARRQQVASQVGGGGGGPPPRESRMAT